MTRTATVRKTVKRDAGVVAAKPELRIVPTEAAAPRGIKLKTVSFLTMAFALVCVGAFLAGRPPVSAANAGVVGTASGPMFIGSRAAVYPVRDLAVAKAWYRNVLEVAPSVDEKSFVEFRSGAGTVDLVATTQNPAKNGSNREIYWGVSNANAAYQRLLALGATPKQPVRQQTSGIFAGTVTDPFGNVLAIVQNANVN